MQILSPLTWAQGRRKAMQEAECHMGKASEEHRRGGRVLRMRWLFSWAVDNT